MRRRVLLAILLVVAATVLALGLPLGLLAWRSPPSQEQTELLTRLQSVVSYVNDENARGAALSLRQLQVAVPDGWLLEITEPGATIPPVGDMGLVHRLTVTGELADGGRVSLAAPLDEVRVQQWKALLLVLAAVAASLLVGMGTAVLLARRLVAPLRDASDRAARLGAGDFRIVSRRYRITELDQMMEVLDATARDIAALVGRERDLAEDISHQLRTRLTALRLRLDELSLSVGDEWKTDVAEALVQTDGLVAVVDELLATARSRRAAGSRELDLAGELNAVNEQWRRPFAAATRPLSVDCPVGTKVRATPVRLREALNGLLDNALRHGGGAVSVTVRPGDRMVLIEVADAGPGVPEPLVGHIFDRGVSTASSTGIGLGLARAFVEADGGRLELRRARPPVFGIFLPVG